jgi:hypothetical protein
MQNYSAVFKMAEYSKLYGFLQRYNVLQMVKHWNNNNPNKNKTNTLIGDTSTGTHQ